MVDAGPEVSLGNNSNSAGTKVTGADHLLGVNITDPAGKLRVRARARISSHVRIIKEGDSRMA